jgi:hypothetical protein
MSIEAIEKRIADLEEKYGPVERVRADLKSKDVFSYSMIRVPADYYDKPIEYRADLLKSSTSQLCKSIVLMNTACQHENVDDPTYSKYYCVLIQYDQKLNSERMKDFIHKMRFDVFDCLVFALSCLFSDLRLREFPRKDSTSNSPPKSSATN